MPSKKLLLILTGLTLFIVGLNGYPAASAELERPVGDQALSVQRLNAVPADYKPGGQRTGGGGSAGEVQNFFQRHLALTIVGLFILGLVLTYLMMTGVARLMAARPPPGVTPATRQELFSRLLALNNPKLPFAVKEGDNCDLMAEWKIVDATWWEIFAKAGLKKIYRLRLALDERRHEVRAIEDLGSVQWQAGAQGPTPTVRYERAFFKGIVIGQKERGVAYGLKSVAPPEVGTIYNYRFDVQEIKGPVVQTITGAGWRFAPALWPWQVRKGG